MVEKARAKDENLKVKEEIRIDEVFAKSPIPCQPKRDEGLAIGNNSMDLLPISENSQK